MNERSVATHEPTSRSGTPFDAISRLDIVPAQASHPPSLDYLILTPSRPPGHPFAASVGPDQLYAAVTNLLTDAGLHRRLRGGVAVLPSCIRRDQPGCWQALQATVAAHRIGVLLLAGPQVSAQLAPGVHPTDRSLETFVRSLVQEQDATREQCFALGEFPPASLPRVASVPMLTFLHPDPALWSRSYRVSRCGAYRRGVGIVRETFQLVARIQALWGRSSLRDFAPRVT